MRRRPNEIVSFILTPLQGELRTHEMKNERRNELKITTVD